MPYKTFVIPARYAGWAERELNAFVGNHRVLSVDWRWVDQGENSFWAALVDYLESPSAAAPDPGGERARKRIDYKEVLSPEDFEVFARLRNWRKAIAEPCWQFRSCCSKPTCGVSFGKAAWSW